MPLCAPLHSCHRLRAPSLSLIRMLSVAQVICQSYLLMKKFDVFLVVRSNEKFHSIHRAESAVVSPTKTNRALNLLNQCVRESVCSFRHDAAILQLKLHLCNRMCSLAVTLGCTLPKGVTEGLGALTLKAYEV